MPLLFKLARTPLIIFGNKKIDELPKLVIKYGSEILIITGSKSFSSYEQSYRILFAIEKEGIKIHHVIVSGEPSPELIDNIVDNHRNKNIKLVIAWGGGSVIDTGKAVSAMLLINNSVMDYIENVGCGIIHPGIKVPFIAIPTTSGTGSEASKNAVLSKIGKQGFKNSLRHDNFIPDVAIIDPELMLKCPPDITAACGMDALTQLMESYLSPEASPITDAIAFSGIEHIKSSIARAYYDGHSDIEARNSMAYASLMSGITLGNTGLGLVHGFASSIGGMHNIPHGVICGTLLSETTSSNIKKLISECGENHPSLIKYAKLGALLSDYKSDNIINNCNNLINILNIFINQFNIPLLSNYGVRIEDIAAIISLTENKNNPIKLSSLEMKNIIEKRL